MPIDVTGSTSIKPIRITKSRTRSDAITTRLVTAPPTNLSTPPVTGPTLSFGHAFSSTNSSKEKSITRIESDSFLENDFLLTSMRVFASLLKGLDLDPIHSKVCYFSNMYFLSFLFLFSLY